MPGAIAKLGEQYPPALRALRQRRDEHWYNGLSHYLDDFGRSFLMNIFHYESHKLFPDPREEVQTLMLEFHKHSIRESGCKLFGLCMGADREDIADEVVRRVLIHCDDAESFKQLLAAAEKSGHKEKSESLLVRAQAVLSKEELKVLLARDRDRS